MSQVGSTYMNHIQLKNYQKECYQDEVYQSLVYKPKMSSLQVVNIGIQLEVTNHAISNNGETEVPVII